jgi:hypothetical protein
MQPSHPQGNLNMRNTLFVLGFILAGLMASPASSADVRQDSAQPTQEERAEAAFREIQVAMTRRPSRAPEDADLMVCERRQPTGSRIGVIECATNRFRESTRPGNTEIVAQNREDMMFQMPMSDFRRLERMFGPLPAGYAASVGAQHSR